MSLANPVTGYGGFNERIAADNIFGLTYADSKEKARESLRKVKMSEQDTLKKTSVFQPLYSTSSLKQK